MIDVGFFIGHESYSDQAQLLVSTFTTHHKAKIDFQLHAMVPSHIRFACRIEKVLVHRFDVPQAYRSIPFVDKMLGAAAFESICDFRYLWLDVDSCFFSAIPDITYHHIMANPVDKRNIGILVNTPKSRLWELLDTYFSCNSTDYPPVTTLISKERILPYWNAGMVLAHVNTGIFSLTARALQNLLAMAKVRSLFFDDKLTELFFHQAVYSFALIRSCPDGVAPLPYGMNYPLHLLHEDTSPPPLADVISIRYDNYFTQRKAPDIYRQVFSAYQDKLKPYWYY